MGLPTVGVIGAGPTGRGIAMLTHRAGYPTRVGTGRIEALSMHEGVPPGVDVSGLRHAAEADIVIVALRHRAAPAVLRMLRNQLAGRIVIDTMNPWIFRDYLVAGLSATFTEGAWLARQLPDSAVVRAFSHIPSDVLVSRALTEPGTWAAACAADEVVAAAVTERLIAKIGYVPVNIGSLADSAALDVGGILWPYMFTPDDMRAALSAPTLHETAPPRRPSAVLTVSERTASPREDR